MGRRERGRDVEEVDEGREGRQIALFSGWYNVVDRTLCIQNL